MCKKLLLVLPILLLSLVLAGCGNTTGQEEGLGAGDIEGGANVVPAQEGLEIVPAEESMSGETATGTTVGSGGEVEILMENLQYNPPQIRVAPGTMVVWMNMDSVAHTVTSGTRDNPDDLFDSGNIAPGETFTYTFDEPGTYDYFCIPHPGMDAVVVVE